MEMARIAIVAAIVAAGVVTACFARSPANAQQAAVASDEELARNFQAEHEIGRRFHFDPADLPPPKTGPVVTDTSLIVPYSGQTPRVPPGFVATLFASGLANPRRLLVLSNGDVLVAEQKV